MVDVKISAALITVDTNGHNNDKSYGTLGPFSIFGE